VSSDLGPGTRPETRSGSFLHSLMAAGCTLRHYAGPVSEQTALAAQQIKPVTGIDLFGFFALSAIGGWLLRRGLRGPAVEVEHPFCKRCGYDLFGRPPESELCPECGANLLRSQAMRCGRHTGRGEE
jgi:predicted RNA-binding Zn-ribbon protein involved in translation (DUF1610 family)